ncbi:hypothetical protein [Labrys sp. 22185]|uniref:hypothetical protein n=1 Tax=Labrys sp. 22185 TaxID=3453888 RepID=UPI003F87C7E4
MEGNLTESARQEVYFCLASSYQNIRKLTLVMRIAKEGAREFPDVISLQPMIALLECDRGTFRMAASMLFSAISTHADNEKLNPFRWFLARESRRLRRKAKTPWDALTDAALAATRPKTVETSIESSIQLSTCRPPPIVFSL